jgi:hypothetical protein
MSTPSATSVIEPSVGTWKLNPDKSKIPNVPSFPKAITLVIEEHGDVREVKSTGAQIDGSPISLRYTIPKLGGVVRIEGTPSPAAGDSAIFKPSDNPYVSEIATLRGGKEVQTQRSVVSGDGNTLTVTTKGVDQEGRPTDRVAVLDKQ